MDLLTNIMVFNSFIQTKNEPNRLELEVKIFYCPNLNLNTHLNVSAWNRLQVQTNIF